MGNKTRKKATNTSSKDNKISTCVLKKGAVIYKACKASSTKQIFA